MRNNMDRMGLSHDQNVHDSVEMPTMPPMRQTESQDNGFIVATELVDLPSKGLFYDENHPLHHKTTIEIKHMTTKEEDILTNQSFLKNGSAIDRMLQSVILDKKVRVKDLYVGDKNALLVASRIYGYGADYDAKFSCPACGTTQKANFNLEEIEHIDFEQNQIEYDVEVDYESATLFLVITRSKAKLELRLIKEEKSDPKAKNRNSISYFYKKIIKSVNGNNNPKYIADYINSMAAVDSRYLRNVYSKIVPGVNFVVEHTCQACYENVEVEVPLTAEFFWPKL